MKEIPILFSTDMVKAILDGRKTMTRRILKVNSQNPYASPGDILWVRESFAFISYALLFKADEPHIFKNIKYKPSIHMPKSLARIWLQVKEVRVERLQDITEADAISEGIIYDELFGKYACPLCHFKGHYLSNTTFLCDDGFYSNAKKAFTELWSSIYGKESWHENPWVLVITFEVLSTTRNPDASANLYYEFI